MRVLTAPEPLRYNKDQRALFLAGSIDMGTAVDWQSEVIGALTSYEGVIFNPRRSDFDPDAEQLITNPYFKEQVEWELNALDAADVIGFFFDPNGKAPITLMELGLHAKSKKAVVCCSPSYWRYGNVQVICNRYRIPLVDNMDAFIKILKGRIA